LIKIKQHNYFVFAENMVEDWAHQYTENEFNVNYDNDPRFVLRQWPPMPWPPMPDYRYMGPEGIVSFIHSLHS
jgi:hypothetical protein